jgi:hypothetical protein
MEVARVAITDAAADVLRLLVAQHGPLLFHAHARPLGCRAALPDPDLPQMRSTLRPAFPLVPTARPFTAAETALPGGG